VWSHDAALDARLDALKVPPAARQATRLTQGTMEASPAPPSTTDAAARAEVAHAQAEALGAALRAVALVSAGCALAGAALAALTIRAASGKTAAPPG
jgi:hypothetical protein